MGGGGDKAANPCRRITARAIDATTATPPQQRRQSNTTAAPGGRQARGGGRGAAPAATPMPPVDAWEQRGRHHPSTICHATVTTERDHGARGTTSTEGASQGNDERIGGGGEGPPAPQRQRCPSRREEDIDTASAASPLRRTYVITAPPGERRAQRGEAGGRPCHNTDAPRRRAGRRHRSATPHQRQRRPNVIAAPGERRARGGARGRPRRIAEAIC
jgi:hypothetical protein